MTTLGIRQWTDGQYTQGDPQITSRRGHGAPWARNALLEQGFRRSCAFIKLSLTTGARYSRTNGLPWLFGRRNSDFKVGMIAHSRRRPSQVSVILMGRNGRSCELPSLSPCASAATPSSANTFASRNGLANDTAPTASHMQRLAHHRRPSFLLIHMTDKTLPLELGLKAGSYWISFPVGEAMAIVSLNTEAPCHGAYTDCT